MRLYTEIDWSIKNKCKKYYLSYGYENTSLYKSRFDGFEFWNGRSWLSNKLLNKYVVNFNAAPTKFGGDGALLVRIKNRFKKFKY